MKRLLLTASFLALLLLPGTAFAATVNYLVVAGGSGEGYRQSGVIRSGGGPGGNVVSGSASVTAGSSYTITVGAAGVNNFDNGNAQLTPGIAGGSSSFDIIATASPGTPQATTPGKGGNVGSFTGGNGDSGTAQGGGGAGAGGNGGAAGTNAGNGGIGVSSSITGSLLFYGGGGSGTDNTGTLGLGGSAVGAGLISGTPSNAVANRGGGGAQYDATGGVSLTPSAGVVIISATTGTFSPTISGANTFTQSGGNDIWKFTANGTWTPTVASTPPTSIIGLIRAFFF